MRLGREVHDDGRALHQRRRHYVVCDVAAHERVARMVHHVAQVLDPAGVRELVQSGHAPVGMDGQRVADEIAADEARAASDEYVNHGSTVST